MQARGVEVSAIEQARSRYDLGEPFAAGGMAEIRRGFDRWAGREIAHKRLRLDREHQRPRMSALFQREYDTLARLKHPNIVEVFDYGFDEQGAYYVMELLSGKDLSKLAPMPLIETCAVLRDIASALALVHTRGFVHRDVSPNNVRLTGDGIAKLIDFGALSPFGRASELAGTPAFIAPECIRDEPLDQRTDIYSLGALAYWTLSGRVAVRAQSIDELTEALGDPIIPISHQVPGVPERMSELVHSMLSKDRAQRPSSAAEVIEQLTAIGSLEPERDERKVAYSYLKHPPLVGRDEALGELSRALDAALQGRGGVLAIEGGVGFGRSALLDQLAIDAQLRGALVLRAEGGAESGPHGIVRRLIQLGMRIYPDLEGSEQFRRRMLEAALETDGAAHPVEALERSTIAAARLRKLLLSLCERSPLVIAIDDADLADEESLGLLASMMHERELGQRPLLLALALGSVRELRSLALERLRQGARTATLRHLEEGEVLSLLSSVFGEVPNVRRIAQWLHSESGGNPAQSIDLLRLLIQQGAVRYHRGTFTLPHDIDASLARDRRVDALMTRVSGLTADARKVVELLGAHPESLSLAQLCHAAGLTSSEVGLAVEQLAHRGVVFAPGDSFSLRGESLRGVLTRVLGDERMRALHLSLARALELHSDGAVATELMVIHHLFRAGEEHEPQAAARTMELLRKHRHDVSFDANAIPLLEASLAHYERVPARRAERAQLLASLSITAFYGNIQAQQKYLRRALYALSHECGLDVARKLRRFIGGYLAMWLALGWAVLLGVFAPRQLSSRSIVRRVSDFLAVASAGVATAAVTWDEETAREIVAQVAMLRGFPTGTAPGLGVQFIFATSELFLSNPARAVRRYERVLRGTQRRRFLMEERLRKQLRLGSLNGHMHALAEHDGKSLCIADELEQGSPFFASHAETLRVIYHSHRGETQLAEQHRARAETLALRGNASWTVASTLSMRVIEPAYYIGDVAALVRAQAELERLVADAPTLQVQLLLARARIALLRGGARDAAAMLEPMLVGGDSGVRLLRATYAEALCQLGEYERAREQSLMVLDALTPHQRAFASALRLPYLPLARAEAGLGKHEAARKVLIEKLDEAEARNNPLELGLLHRELSSIALSARDGYAFDRHLSLMTAQFRSTQHPNLVRAREILLARAVAAGLKDSPSGAYLPQGDDGLDDETVIEPRSSSRTAAPVRES